jgi:hypothetical protein
MQPPVGFCISLDEEIRFTDTRPWFRFAWRRCDRNVLGEGLRQSRVDDLGHREQNPNARGDQ